MGLVTENRDKNGILAPLSVRDNIALPFLEKTEKNGLIDGAAIKTLVTRAIQDTSTKASSPDQEVRSLSGGNKQKICFSRWLDPDLEFLILLEPPRGIDVHAKADIYHIIEDMAERGVGYFQFTYQQGQRCSAAYAFIAPLENDPKLTLKLEAGVQKNIIENERTVGVVYK
ncbi:MAG: hypothetical protein ACR2Q4_00525 [Geminicoccaceae bacterium]